MHPDDPPGTSKRRGPRVSKGPPGEARGRKARAGTLTLDKLREHLVDPLHLGPSGDRYPRRQEALAKQRQAVQDGDLLALFSAIEISFRPLREGFSFEDASLNPDLEKMNVCEVPAWLLGEMSILLWRGMAGDWPARRGAAAPARRHLAAQRDLWCAWHVLKAREERIAWEDVFEYVAARAKGEAGSPSAIEKAYRRVVHNLRDDPDYYRRLFSMQPHLLDAAVAPPRKG